MLPVFPFLFFFLFFLILSTLNRLWLCSPKFSLFFVFLSLMFFMQDHAGIPGGYLSSLPSCPVLRACDTWRESFFFHCILATIVICMGRNLLFTCFSTLNSDAGRLFFFDCDSVVLIFILYFLYDALQVGLLSFLARFAHITGWQSDKFLCASVFNLLDI